MAIGDKPNQNLFGTNFNPEDEEEKKARLAAQGAMMGAGVPALDSNIVAQVPGIQNIRNPGAFNPVNMETVEPVGPPTTVGESISQTYNESVLADLVNKGFGQEAFQSQAPDGTPTYSIYNKRFGTLGSQVPYSEAGPEAKAQAMNFMLETGGQERPLPETPTSPVRTPEQVQSILGEQRAAQAAQAASNLEATPSVTPPVETPSEGAQEQEAAQAPTAPTGGLTTVGGASLSEFLSGQAMPEQGFTQEESPLGGRGVTLTPDQMNELSAQREARLDARPDFGEAVSDRDRRAARGDGISMADQVDMAKSNARGATPREVARGNQVANALGVDLKTGKPLQATGGLTFEQQLSLRKQNFAEGKFDYELAKDAKTAYSEGIEASRKATTEEAQADTAGRTMVSAISNMNDAMTRMGGRSGEFFGSGFFGKASSFIPGTSAYDQVADVEFLQSNVALNAMSELKELSPTGSTGFGALSEKELRVLTDKYANLNPFTSPDLFQKNLKQLQGEFNNMLNNAWDKHSKEYSPEAANAIYGNRGGSGATGTPGQAIPNDRNITSAADTLLSDPKYN